MTPRGDVPVLPEIIRLGSSGLFRYEPLWWSITPVVDILFVVGKAA